MTESQAIRDYAKKTHTLSVAKADLKYLNTILGSEARIKETRIRIKALEIEQAEALKIAHSYD